MNETQLFINRIQPSRHDERAHDHSPRPPECPSPPPPAHTHAHPTVRRQGHTTMISYHQSRSAFVVLFCLFVLVVHHFCRCTYCFVFICSYFLYPPRSLLSLSTKATAETNKKREERDRETADPAASPPPHPVP